MRILVCGHREFDDWDLLCETMKRNGIIDREVLDELTIIEGEAKGADFLARVWAKHFKVKYEAYPADWKTYGKKAGPIRNAQMLREGKPELVIAFLAEGSVGTKDMINQAEKAGVPVKVIKI